MKKYFFMLLFLSVKTIVAQDSIQKITISFNETPIEKALKSIEKLSNYTFFYVSDWFGKDSVSGEFKKKSIENVLNTILKNTTINYYILNKTEVILTQNNIVYDQLPDNFLSYKKETENEVTALAPVFYEDSFFNKNDIIKIGKADKNSKKSKFSLTGIVVSEETRKPIPNVLILVKKTGLWTTTNNKGFYKLDLPLGLSVLEISTLNVEKKTKNVLMYNNGELNIELREVSEELDEVVIRANRNVNVVKTISGVTQIEISKIKTIPLVLGELDILKVATTFPGISTAGEGASGYNVRGGKVDQNLILLDNMVIYNSAHFLGMFTGLNPFTSSSINIYKGSIPAEFGGRLSSVFDIKTKDGNNKKFSGEASIGPIMTNLVLEIPIVKGKSSLLLGGRTTYSDWILRSLNTESLKNSKASFNDLVMKYDYTINENNSLKVSGYMSNDKFSVTSDSLYSYSNKLISVNWNRKLNEKNRLNVILANSSYGFKINYEKEDQGGFDLGYRINETQLKFKFQHQINKNHKLTYGASTKLYNVNPGNLNPVGEKSTYTKIDIQKEKALESALFVSDNIKVSEKLQLDLGLRYSNFLSLGPSTQRVYENDVPKGDETLLSEPKYSNNEVIKSNGGLEMRISTRYFLKDNFSMKASYNTNYQYIHTLSNNTTASPTDIWKLSDLNIKPQRAEQVSLGFYRNLNEDMYEISVEGYYKKLKNTLDYKTGAKLFLNKNIETKVLQGEGKSYGAEFLIKKTRGKLNGWVGYTYSRSLNKFVSNYASETINKGVFFSSNYDKPHDFSLVANYKLTNRYSLSTNVIYQTGRPVTLPTSRYTFNNNEYITYSDRNKFRIPNYYRLDISLNIEGNHKIKKFAHSFWNISIYNVLGRNNPYSVFFVTEDSKIKAYKSSIFSMPIPTITYNFKF
tara:strand:- start:5664 stop:8408 length:2745 start_codon:yes stop_codon:yes gene_type:complete